MNSNYNADEAFERIKAEPQLNVDGAMKHAAGSKKIYLNVVETFCNTFAKKIDELQTYYQGKDNDNFRIVVHGSKSALMLIGAEVLSEAAKQLELASREERMGYIDEHFAAFLDNLKTLRDRLENIIKVEDTQQEDCGLECNDFSFLLDRLKLLKMMLEMLDTDEAEAILNELLAKGYGKEIRTMLEDIRVQVDGYEYDQSLEKIQQLELWVER